MEDAIEDAKRNAGMNGITNCSFFAGDMKDVLSPAFIAQHGHPDVIILDPPRAGIHPDVARVILDAEPDRIVYVSCNPASQARDLNLLCAKYEITAVQPVDMFPHTQHVETVVLLSKGEVDSKKIRVEFSLEDMDMSEFRCLTCISHRLSGNVGLRLARTTICQNPKIPDSPCVRQKKRKQSEKHSNILG